MARVAWAVVWASREEEKGVSFSGVDVFYAAPETPGAAKKWALKNAREIARLNGIMLMDPYAAMEELYARAVAANDAVGRRSESASRFGSDIGLQVLGSGVSWFDDNEEFDLKLPHSEFWM